MIEAIVTDIAFALRWLRRAPGFTAVAVLSLAIGIGVNTALFAVVDAFLFRPLGVAGERRLVDVYTTGSTSSGAGRYGTTSYPDFLDLKSSNSVFDDTLGYTPMFTAMSLGDRSRLTLGEIVTGNYFRMLGVGAARGRTLLPEDDRPGAPRVAMISYRYWTRELGGAPDAIGRTLRLRGHAYAIVGVVSPGFTGLTPVLSPDLWVPISAEADVEPVGLHETVPSPTGATRLERRGDRWLFVKGRLKADERVEQAGANLELIMSGLAAANPATNRDRHALVMPTTSVRFHPAADPVLVPIAGGLMLVVGLVLLIACANVASMLLARASGRQKEIGIRLAIGASRGRVMRQLVTESIVLAGIGAAAGAALAAWATRAISTVSLPIPIPIAFDLHVDARALLFTAGAALAAGVVAGLAPAISASRVDPIVDLRGDVPLARAGGRRWTLRDGLVAAQIAVTALLLVVAGLLTRGLAAALRADLGFDAHHLAIVSVDTGMIGYSPERTEAFFRDAQARVRAIPGVESVALSTRVPFSLNYNRWDIWLPGFAPDRTETVEVTRVSPEYFQTIGVPIVQGRGITADDRIGTPLVAVVNETMARRYWPGGSAVGKQFHVLGPNGKAFQIVGVSADHKVATVGEPAQPFIQMARAQGPAPYAVVLARTRGDAGALLREMRAELTGLEPNIVFVENQTMDGEVSATLFPVRVAATVAGTMGLVAMALAGIGLYGVIAYSVARRTREIGIRMALGARPGAVVALVMRQGLLLAGIGVVIGFVLAGVASRAIAGELYGVSLGDPIAWAGTMAIVLLTSAIANLIPARRAARVHPSEALRVE